MARILKKIPDFKLPKYKMKEVGDLEELRMEYAEKNIDDFKKKMEHRRAQETYPGTHYRTVKEFFLRSTELYKDRPFILQTFNKKEGFREISYGQFRRDVNDFGTALTRVLDLQGEKVMILSETTYELSLIHIFPASAAFAYVLVPVCIFNIVISSSYVILP